MKITSWNVNGIRAVIKKGFWEWFDSYNFDVVNIQENKANKLDVKVNLEKDDYSLSWAEALKKGYSGVSSWYKKDFKEFQIGLGESKFDKEGRTIVLEHSDFFIINGYFPNGREDHSKVKYKLDYSFAVLELAEKLRNKYNKGVIICGDINTAHNEIDLARPKTNKNSTGFLIEEREFIDKLESKGYVDAYRTLNPKDVQYSWWSYRAGARKNNVGWRIDYFFVSEDIKHLIKDCYYMQNQLGSDHCPVVLELNI